MFLFLPRKWIHWFSAQELRTTGLLHLLYWADFSWSRTVLDTICTSILESCIHALPHLHWPFHLHLCDSCGTHGYYWETHFWPVSMKKTVFVWFSWLNVKTTDAVLLYSCTTFVCHNPGARQSTRTLLQRPHLSTSLGYSWWPLEVSSSSLSLKNLGNGLLTRSCTTPSP